MVINAMIVAMAANANRPNESIYHVGSSVSNPLELKWFQVFGKIYFSQNPWIDKDGKPVIVGKVTMFDTMDSFQRYMALHYLLPLKVWFGFILILALLYDIFSSSIWFWFVILSNLF